MQAADTAASTPSRNEPSRFAAWRLSFVFGQFAMARRYRWHARRVRYQSAIVNLKWAVRGSNPRPSRCKRDALPLS